LASVTTCLGVIGAAFSQRVLTQRWIRYRIELAEDLPVSPGWRPYGAITRYQLDVQGLGAYAVYLHSSGDRAALGLHHALPV